MTVKTKGGKKMRTEAIEVDLFCVPFFRRQNMRERQKSKRKTERERGTFFFGWEEGIYIFTPARSVIFKNDTFNSLSSCFEAGARVKATNEERAMHEGEERWLWNLISTQPFTIVIPIVHTRTINRQVRLCSYNGIPLFGSYDDLNIGDDVIDDGFGV